jgi:hypothetical protein
MAGTADTMKSQATSKACGINSAVALLLTIFAIIACSSFVKDYKPREFDSAKWKNGNRTVRGTMYFDLFEKHTLSNKTRDDVVQLLGEPDKKVTVEGREVWLYRIDIRGEWSRPCFPVSFEPGGKTFAGMVHRGTMSMLTEEAEAK